jgi:hypothetical protein
MIKDANTQKAWLSASATFWMSLLVSSVMVHGLALQARADEVPGKEAIASSTKEEITSLPCLKSYSLSLMRSMYLLIKSPL